MPRNLVLVAVMALALAALAFSLVAVMAQSPAPPATPTPAVSGQQTPTHTLTFTAGEYARRSLAPDGCTEAQPPHFHPGHILGDYMSLRDPARGNNESHDLIIPRVDDPVRASFNGLRLGTGWIEGAPVIAGAWRGVGRVSCGKTGIQRAYDFRIVVAQPVNPALTTEDGLNWHTHGAERRVRELEAQLAAVKAELAALRDAFCRTLDDGGALWRSTGCRVLPPLR